MSDVRRCRRCKRKRMDDEPPEVKQYKTCAKCRIIERQKKKSRKPLAEETVLYGMKQFQQQNQNTSFLKDDMDFDSYSKYDNNFGNQKYQYSYQYDNHGTTGASGAGVGMTGSGSNGTHAMAGGNGGNYGMGATGGLGTATASSIPQTYNLNYQLVAQKALPMQSTNLPQNNNLLPINCDVCNKKLDPNDELTISYKLCVDCYANPFKLYNVFEDYNDFLLNIGNNNAKNILNYIFIKEIDKNFIDNLNQVGKFVNEYKFRENILENLSKIYIEPIIASTSYKFLPVSSNLKEFQPQTINHHQNQNNGSEFKHTKPIKVYYKCQDEISNKINCQSNLFMDYDLSTNLLKIKFNHKRHNYFSIYPTSFINHINKLIERLKSSITDGDITYNAATGKLVYDELINHDEFKDIITSINKDDFIDNFHHLEDVSEKPESHEAKATNGGTSHHPASNNVLNVPVDPVIPSIDSVDVPIEKILDPAFS